MKEGDCLAVCESIHDVIALEKELKSRGHGCSMVPTPRVISSDCGMSLKYPKDSHQVVLDVAVSFKLHLEQTCQLVEGKLIKL